MSSKILPSDQNDDTTSKQHNLKSKKERVIAPLTKAEGGSSDDLLAELRAKTAELAEKVHGSEAPPARILKLEDDEEDLSINEKDDQKNQINETKKPNNANPAADLIRQKVARLYDKEPDATEEAEEVLDTLGKKSKHQQFMYDLTTSKKSLAEIQTAWHHYYIDLPDHEKHEVWQEFYAMQHEQSQHQLIKQQALPPKSISETKKDGVETVDSKDEKQSVTDIKSQLIKKVNADGKLKPIHHLKSLLFGFGLAGMVGLLVAFTFFNEVFVAPFISPSQSVSATPIIGSDTGPIGPEPKIIIPKINLEVPVVFDMESIQEDDIQSALEDGVVHYATTPNPGEQGNSVIVGHSSNNLLNSGRYKFAFVLLKRLENQDTFFVHRDGVRYTYQVYRKEIVPPDAVGVLSTQDRPNTMTLITCDPPGTSINRLIIVAEQISPDPSTNTVSSAPDISEVETDQLPSNAPSLWSRIWPF